MMVEIGAPVMVLVLVMMISNFAAKSAIIC